VVSTPRRRNAARGAVIGVLGLAAVTGCGASTPTSSLSDSGTSGTSSSPASPSASSPSAESTRPTPTVDPATECVSHTLDTLSDEQRLGQLLMVGLDTNAAAGSLDATIGQRHVGNVIYLGGWSGADRVTRTSQHLQGLAGDDATGGIGLMIAADQEGGVVHQLRGEGFTQPPSALTQGAMDPDELTRLATGWAKEMAAAGVNVNLAPVADTVPAALGTANGPIGKWGREYGHTPDVVSRGVQAFVKGMSAGGVTSTVKHFPGLGRVTGNTDFASTGITDTKTTADDPYLTPFVDGVAAGAGLVMTSSAFYSRIDPDHQAMFSSTVVTDLLRDKLGYEGVVITDDVGAAAAVQSIPVGERAVKAIAAGNDIVLTGRASDARTMLGALAAKATADEGFAAQLDASVQRVLTLKYRMGLLPCSADLTG
jgi:beta-N-acetylhexosaminidase